MWIPGLLRIEIHALCNVTLPVLAALIMDNATRERVRAHLIKARRELEFAKQHPSCSCDVCGPYGHTFYACHKAAEKAIRGFLCFYGHEPEECKRFEAPWSRPQNLGPIWGPLRTFTRTARSFLFTLWWFMDLPPLLRNELLDRRIELGWFKWLRHCQCQTEPSYLLPFLRGCAATDHHNRCVLECCDSADLLNELVPRSAGAEHISRNQVWMVG